ncbi:MAG: ComEA family DNA-binding protein [Acholeplasmataceae bacterium]|nr:ComEA family DNA-binding protein [Acholeplasmataceae bacterium]
MKKHLKKIICVAVVLVLFILGIILNNHQNEDYGDDEGTTPIFSSNIVVEIKGEVRFPGVYYMTSEDRIYDAIRIAGGMTASADLTNINLAEKIKDGTAIIIPSKAKSENTKISINNASLEELMTLTGIGEVKAKNIIKYRNQIGKFISLEELKNVDGISENLYRQIKEFICL